MTKDEMWRLEEAIDGLREALNALTDNDGNVHSPMASAIGCDLSWLEHTVTEMRWLLEVMERVQQREAA